jgi:prevent-host-death family protein
MEVIVPVTNISEAKAQLSALIERVLAGEEIVIGKAGKPVAKLVPFERPHRPRVAGALKGRIRIADDFDELPDDLRTAFGVDGE